MASLSRWTLLVPLLLGTGCVAIANGKLKRALAAEGTAALDALATDGTYDLLETDTSAWEEAFKAELCARRLDRAAALRPSEQWVDSWVKDVVEKGCGAEVAAAKPAVAAWYASHPLRNSSAFSELCQAGVLPPCTGTCPAVGSKDSVQRRLGEYDDVRWQEVPLTLRCVGVVTEREGPVVYVDTPELGVLRADSLESAARARRAVEAERLAAEKRGRDADAILALLEANGRLPAWAQPYMPPEDARERLAALDSDTRAVVKRYVEARALRNEADPAVLPAARPSFARIMPTLLQASVGDGLNAPFHFTSIGRYGRLHQLFAQDTPLADRLVAWSEWETFPDNLGLGAEPFITDAMRQAVVSLVREQTAALRARAASSGLPKLAADAAWLEALLTAPLGFDADLAALIRDVRAHSSSSYFANFDLPLFGLRWDSEDAAKAYATAPLKVRLTSKDFSGKTETRTHESLSVRASTGDESAQASELRQRRAALQAELDSLDAQLRAGPPAAPGVGQAASGVVDYRCDPNNTNCRAVRQGGGESASSYLHRTRTQGSGPAVDLRARRDEVAAELSALPLPSSGGYDKSIKTQTWNLGSAALAYEVLRADGTTDRRSGSGDLQSKEGAAGVGRGLTMEELRYQLMTNLFLDFEKHMEAELSRLAVPAPTLGHERTPTPDDAQLEACLQRKGPRSIVPCMKELGPRPTPR